jgi:hypothetical protein
LEGYPEASLDEVQKGALVMLVMNRDVGDPNRDIGDPGGRDFKFGLTGMLLMVGAAVILMIVS